MKYNQKNFAFHFITLFIILKKTFINLNFTILIRFSDILFYNKQSIVFIIIIYIYILINIFIKY
jgi:hypothetical protein